MRSSIAAVSTRSPANASSQLLKARFDVRKHDVLRTLDETERDDPGSAPSVLKCFAPARSYACCRRALRAARRRRPAARSWQAKRVSTFSSSQNSQPASPTFAYDESHTGILRVTRLQCGEYHTGHLRCSRAGAAAAERASVVGRGLPRCRDSLSLGCLASNQRTPLSRGGGVLQMLVVCGTRSARIQYRLMPHVIAPTTKENHRRHACPGISSLAKHNFTNHLAI